MSEVKSYRLNDSTLVLLEKLQDLTDFNEREIIEAAVEKLFEDWENLDNDIVIDFHDNLFGINNAKVDKFISSLGKAGYIISYYGNGDRLVIKEKQ